jgi:hypothetical protein
MEKYDALVSVSQTMIGIWYGNDASKFELSDIFHAVDRCDELFDGRLELSDRVEDRIAVAWRGACNYVRCSLLHDTPYVSGQAREVWIKSCRPTRRWKYLAPTALYSGRQAFTSAVLAL